MALLDVEDVVAGVAALLDDPGQTEIDGDYVIPFINLRWSNICVNLAMLGLQYGEQVAIFDVDPNTVTLATQMQKGQPLASLMQPKSIDWKPQGAPDSQYVPSNRVGELADVQLGSQGVPEYSWQGGAVQVTPSTVPVTLRVRYQSMSTTLIDPTDQMVRGVSDVVAYKVAELIYAIRGNDKLQATMRADGAQTLDDFLAMSTLNAQAIFTRIPATHGRSLRRGFVALATPR